ncbi:DUF1622 domain-containing protein [Hyphomonas sp. FCG-A18]|uniref:DUF1622 domain-containing protein n=1 Tax=Hyphomonas sp. FCG-A18 TaxID=3080019 RepID=UPI002B2FF4C5|nr:DUF1622 domain-containing protein [Hyphomonas sp. FCG-A18]
MSGSEHPMEGMTGGSSLDALPFEIGPMLAEVFEVMAVGIDLIGVAIIIFGFNVALLKLLSALLQGAGLRRGLGNIAEARRTLGAYILTGIEFMIASDIIHTVITRELTDLIFVGLLVVIRTAISFFLGKEIAELEHREQQA